MTLYDQALDVYEAEAKGEEDQAAQAQPSYVT